MRVARRVGLAALAAVLMGLSACGTTEPAAGPPTTSAAAAPAAEITVTDLRGKEITLPGPATRVVGLEWNVVEHAVSLGVMPVGAADIAGYKLWVQAEPLDSSVKDVGLRGEPSIDSIAALRPDLILAADELPEAAVGQLEALAPVVFVAGGDTKDGIGQMRRNLELVAKLTGKDAEATTELAAFDAKLAEGKAALAARAGQHFAFADAYVEGSQVAIRPFAKGSLISDVTEQLGLVNAWPEPGDETYGLGEADVEGLTKIGDAHFLYIANSDDGGDPFLDVLGDNAVWKSLPFVKSGDVHRIPDGMWTFGGPTSMDRYVDAVVAALR